jgi:uncharacterized repeat protein (TIGR03803 family)
LRWRAFDAVRTLLALLAGLLGSPLAAEEVVLQLVSLGSSAGIIHFQASGMSCGATCSTTVEFGEQVMLTAVPAAGYRFESWHGDCAGSASECTLLMGGTRLAIAAFARASGSGSVIHRFLPGLQDGEGGTSDLLVSDGYLFGMTGEGGRAGAGCVFRERTDGSQHKVLHDFVGGASDGASPYGSLIESGGALYGMTNRGGAVDLGTVFKINPDGSGFQLLHSFVGGPLDGSLPYGSLVESGGVLFGMTASGGTGVAGTVFKIDPNGGSFALLHSFGGGAADGRTPYGALIESGGVLFGMSFFGGPGDLGTVFRLNRDGTGFMVLHLFAGGATDGRNPYGSLVEYGGALYGMSHCGGFNDLGTVFRLNLDGTGFAVLHSFSGDATDGGVPRGSLSELGGSLYGLTTGGGEYGRGTAFRIDSDGGSFALLHSFALSIADGNSPWGSLTESGGVLFGLTVSGGAIDRGTVFRFNPDGSGYALLHSFIAVAAEGRNPTGSLVDCDGALCGMTYGGGMSGHGTVYKVGLDGSTFSLVHSFDGSATDGSAPWDSLTTLGGLLYGMTSYGGVVGNGSIFRVDSEGTEFTVLHSFVGGNADGSTPFGSVLESGGKLLGMTWGGGAEAHGTVFSIDASGSGFALLHSFGGGPSDGGSPLSSLIMSGGVLYGMTRAGGATDRGSIFRMNPDGSGFSLLHSFLGGASDGESPTGALVDLGGVLFGSTEQGGAADAGVVFAINTDGTGFRLVHSFTGGAADGRYPVGTLVSIGGSLYGMTNRGGEEDLGTVFWIDLDRNGFALLHSFTGAEGENPGGSNSLTLNQAWLYGLTSRGGIDHNGVVFRISIVGTDTPAIYRSSDRSWYLKNSTAPGAADLVFPYGDPLDQAVKGDWDGDGDDTVGIYRDGVFFLKNTNGPGNADLVIGFGAPGDIPVAGDWDGDGIDTIGVYRPSEAAWFLRNSNAAGSPDLAFTYGLSNETPVTGDWDGDGIDTVGIFRASDRQWYLHNSNASGNAELVFPYGDPAQDVPVVGDWDGDGDDTVGIYRAALGEWFLKNTNEAGFADLNFVYGLVNEKPLAGDWDGN